MPQAPFKPLPHITRRWDQTLKSQAPIAIGRSAGVLFLCNIKRRDRDRFNTLCPAACFTPLIRCTDQRLSANRIAPRQSQSQHLWCTPRLIASRSDCDPPIISQPSILPAIGRPALNRILSPDRRSQVLLSVFRLNLCRPFLLQIDGQRSIASFLPIADRKPFLRLPI